ncbi:hypothetical protein [Halogeometricum limi]|uniref:Uncharacterized protein n=1 Tax=Halogeometricum limi TaxID=555875 RepID=A0A1I6I544_9EURY|nr:hypothetical protein [Halogeometricum limi]SFR61789.1 hypothetical protein SAMN04488124_2832 [Halogeometricum limi]
MNRTVVLRAAVVSAVLGAFAGSIVGWGGMQPLGLVAGALVGYSVVRVSDAIFDGALAGLFGGLLAVVLVVPVAFVRFVLQTGDVSTGGQLSAHAAVKGVLYVPVSYALGALVAAVAVYYLEPRLARTVGGRTTR